MKTFFYIDRSKIYNRYDPSFYVRQSKLTDSISLYKVVDVLGGKRIPKGMNYTEKPTNYLYLRVADISDNYIDFTNLKHIDNKVYEILRRYEIFNNNIALSIAGTIGKVVYINNIPENTHIILTENCAKLVVKRHQEILPFYLKIVLELDVVQQQIQDNYIQTTIPKLSLERIKHLSIPLPPDLQKQQEIIDKYMYAYHVKQKKEQEATDLLNSIDDYLLSELGIDRVTDTRRENGRFFYTSHKEVTGKRLDPLAYSEQAKLLKQSITSGKYSCSTLKSLIIQESAGDWGIDVTDDYDESIYSKCLVLRSTEFNLYHNIVVDNSKAKYRLISNRKLDSIDLQPNDLIIEKSGGSENQPVGRIAIITKDLYERDRLCYSNFVQKIRLDNSQVLPTYACFFLRLVHNMRLTETMQSQTNGIRNLILSEYYNQQIPVPPIEKQKEIIYHIEALYNRAKQLQHEATTTLSNAKMEIEQMILG